MNRLTRAVLLLAVLGAPAAAASDAVSRALGSEMGRTMARLEMEGRGRPFFLSYRVDEATSVFITASFGAARSSAARSRFAAVDLRVGERAFDQTHYVSKGEWDYRPLVADLPIDDDEDAVRFALWSLTDQAYKKALEKLAQKAAYRDAHNISDEPPDLSVDPVAVSTRAREDDALDASLWEGRARRVSAIFRKYPSLQDSMVSVNLKLGTRYFLDSEGRRSVAAADFHEIVLTAWTQGSDGLPISDSRRFLCRRLADLPDEAALAAAAEELARSVTELVRAPLMSSYLGPVLLEGQASAEFFNQLFARNASSPRAPWVEEDWMRKYYPAGGLAQRFGLRAVSPLLDIEDDPGLAAWNGIPLAGGYGIDDEGLPAQKISLVRKGLLQDVLMSRSPIKERARSNGHGRAGYGEVVVSRPSNLVIRADSAVTMRELEAHLRQQARDFGLPYGLLIRRLGEEDDQEEGKTLSDPVVVYKVYVDDGRRELVRGAAFDNVTLRALRDVIAASTDEFVYNYAQLGPYRYSRGSVPASIVSPSILVSEMELKKTERKPTHLPYLAHPFFAR